jgi:hypothetical protein
MPALSQRTAWQPDVPAVGNPVVKCIIHEPERDMSNDDYKQWATHWAIRQGVSGSFSGRPSIKPGPGVAGGYIDIRNLENGMIGHFSYMVADMSADIGFSIGKESGEWTYFETQDYVNFEDFEGTVRMYSLEVITATPVSRIHLPVEIVHDNLWKQLNWNSVDIGGTNDSVGLGIGWGFGALTLDSVEDGIPPPGLLDDVRELVDEIQFGPPRYDVAADVASRETNLEAEANAGQYDMRQDLPVEPYDVAADVASRETNLEAEANAGQYDMRQDLPPAPFNPEAEAASRETNLEAEANAGQYDMRQDIIGLETPATATPQGVDPAEAAPAATDAAREVDYDGDGVADGTEAAPAALLSDGVGGDDAAGAGAGISTHSDAGGISPHLDADVVGTVDQQHGGADTTPDTHHGGGLTDDPAGLGLPDGDLDGGMSMDPAGLGLPDGDLDGGMSMDPAGLGLPDGDLDAGMSMDPAELGLPDGDGGMADGDGGVALPDADQYQVQPVDQQQMQPVDQNQVEHPEGPA